MGAASGALTGAMVGMMAGPQAAAVAAIIGGVVGAASGFMAASGEEKKQKQMLRSTRNELEMTFGSVEKIKRSGGPPGRELGRALGHEGSDPVSGRDRSPEPRPRQREEIVDDLRASLEATAKAGALLSKVDFATIKEHREHGHPGMDEALGAFMQSQQTSALAGLDAFLTNAQITTERGALAISASLASIYEGLIAQGVAPTAAFAQMEGVVAKLQARLTEAGFTGAAAFGPLSALATLAADAVGGPVMDAMAGLSQALTSTFNLGLLNQETFAGFAAELLGGFKQMEALGQGGEVALSAMQGGLQKLWELSTDFGYTLEPNEQAMLDFAEASGTVGEKFRPAADRMANAIDALVDRMDKFLTRFEQVLPAAANAAAGIQKTLGDIKVEPIEIPFRPRWDEGYTRAGIQRPRAGRDPGPRPPAASSAAHARAHRRGGPRGRRPAVEGPARRRATPTSISMAR